MSFLSTINLLEESFNLNPGGIPPNFLPLGVIDKS
jgi:hypothetical protein